MLHRLHHLLREKGTLELLLLFAVITLSVDLVSSAGAMDLGELDANFRCVSGKMDNVKRQGQGGEQDVTVADGQTMVKLEKTPKATFRAMVRGANQLDYELVVDYEKERMEKCKEAIKGLVEAEGCELAEDWRGGKCAGGKCTGGWRRVTCGLSDVQQVQEDSGPTGYSLTDVTVWSSEECLSVSAKFTDTDKNFCYLVPSDHLNETSRTVRKFTGRTTTTSTTEATTTGTTAAKTTTEKTTSTETNTATKVVSTMTTGENTTTAETTTTEDGTTTETTQGTTAKPTNTDEPATGPTTKDPAGFRLAWYIWMIAGIVVVVLVGLGAWAYFWHRHRRANKQKDEEELLGSDHKQSGSGESDGKSAKGKTKKAAEKEDNKDDGHEQVKSGSSHYFTKSAAKSEVSGEKQEETTKPTQRVSIIVPDSSSLSEAPEKEKSTTDGAEKSKESGEKKEEIAKKEGTVQDNGYEVMGSTLLGAAGVGIPSTETATVSEVPAKKETTNDGYEKLDDVV